MLTEYNFPKWGRVLSEAVNDGGVPDYVWLCLPPPAYVWARKCVYVCVCVWGTRGAGTVGEVLSLIKKWHVAAVSSVLVHAGRLTGHNAALMTNGPVTSLWGRGEDASVPVDKALFPVGQVSVGPLTCALYGSYTSDACCSPSAGWSCAAVSNETVCCNLNLKLNLLRFYVKHHLPYKHKTQKSAIETTKI